MSEIDGSQVKIHQRKRKKYNIGSDSGSDNEQNELTSAKNPFIQIVSDLTILIFFDQSK